MEAAKAPKKKAVTSAKKPAKRAVKIPPKAIPAPSLGLYRRIAGVFVLLVAIVLVVVLFVSTTKATIRIQPVENVVESAFLVQVVPTAVVQGKVKGSVVRRTFEQAERFEVSGGEQKEVLGKSGGTVMIVNESSRSQPLVATTRLLSSGGVLFRLDAGVTVPAGASVQAVVHADQEGQTGDIEPNRFTIPGLSTSLQSVIYATSDAPMTGGRKLVSVLAEEQLEQAGAVLEKAMFEKAKSQLVAEAEAGMGNVFEYTVLEKKSDTLPGVESDQFTISMRMEVMGVFYDAKSLSELSEAKLYESLQEGFAFRDGATPVELTIEAFDVENQTAELRAKRQATSVVSMTNEALERGQFVGLTEQEVEDRLKTAGIAMKVEVDIFPFWARKIPSLKDHIDIVIE